MQRVRSRPTLASGAHRRPGGPPAHAPPTRSASVSHTLTVVAMRGSCFLSPYCEPSHVTPTRSSRGSRRECLRNKETTLGGRVVSRDSGEGREPEIRTKRILPASTCGETAHDLRPSTHVMRGQGREEENFGPPKRTGAARHSQTKRKRTAKGTQRTLSVVSSHMTSDPTSHECGWAGPKTAGGVGVPL